jgi:hypothetical protein
MTKITPKGRFLDTAPQLLILFLFESMDSTDSIDILKVGGCPEHTRPAKLKNIWTDDENEKEQIMRSTYDGLLRGIKDDFS